MKKINLTLLGSLCAFFGLITANLLVAQDARVYYEGTYYRGPYIDLNIGETTFVTSDGDEISIRIYNSNAAIKVTCLDKLLYQWGTAPTNFFIYTERDFPEVFGTDQYENVRLKVECLQKANSYQELPQPDIFVSFDYSSSNPNPENDSHLLPLDPDHRMLVLRRAFLWENSEDLGGFHGPYGDVKIGSYNPIVLSYSEEVLVQNTLLWNRSELIKHKSDLPGPIWSGYAEANPPPIPSYPDPYDEWIDGPFGCIYSNIAVMDWGTNPSQNESVGIIISEADSPDSFMGKSQFAITPFMEGPIIVKVWGFGWVVLENIWVPASGKELTVAQSNVYWYGSWDGVYPVNVYGPQNPAIPCESCPGSQFRPFTDAQFWNFHNDARFDGYKVGLMGSKFPAAILNRPRTYIATDKEKPAVLGKR